MVLYKPTYNSIILGRSLPAPIYAASVVQTENTFLIVGGLGQSANSLDTIYRYEPTTGAWTLMRTRLSHTVGRVAAVIADKW